MRFTELYVNKVYLVYNVVVYRLLVTGLIPSFLLIYMYTKIYACIRASHGFRDNSIRGGTRCGPCSIGSEDIEVRKKESKHARMFAGVVAVFILCQGPNLIEKFGT